MQRKTVPGKTVDLWAAKEVLYATCPTCFRHMQWMRRNESGVTLHSFCCGKAWAADPHYDYTKFHVTVGEADMQNVRILSTIDV